MIFLCKLLSFIYKRSARMSHLKLAWHFHNQRKFALCIVYNIMCMLVSVCVTVCRPVHRGGSRGFGRTPFFGQVQTFANFLQREAKSGSITSSTIGQSYHIRTGTRLARDQVYPQHVRARIACTVLIHWSGVYLSSKDGSSD